MKPIMPLTRPIIVNGRLIYHESVRAYNTIRLKKRLLDEFSQLRSEDNWCWQIEHWRSYDATLERIKEAQQKEEGIPLLLFIYREKHSEQ